MPPNGETRWGRLERYCRWKQGRFRIECLPHDAVLLIISHLVHADVCALLNALYAVSRENIQNRREALMVPSELRYQWLYGAACDSLRRIAILISEIAFFHARECTSVCAHVNWSAFSGPFIPVPLCVYRWSSSRCAVVDVNDGEVLRIVRDASATGSTSVTLALYCYMEWGGTVVIKPEPCHRMVHHVFPYFLASESRHSGISWRDHCNARIGGPNTTGIISTTAM
jgi:hypothetical protein